MQASKQEANKIFLGARPEKASGAKKEWAWSIGVSIPVPRACKAHTLPIELMPRAEKVCVSRHLAPDKIAGQQRRHHPGWSRGHSSAVEHGIADPAVAGSIPAGPSCLFCFSVLLCWLQKKNLSPRRRRRAHCNCRQTKKDATPRGFEPLRTKSTHLAGERLNHSAKVSIGARGYCLRLKKISHAAPSQPALEKKQKQKNESTAAGFEPTRAEPIRFQV